MALMGCVALLSLRDVMNSILAAAAPQQVRAALHWHHRHALSVVLVLRDTVVNRPHRADHSSKLARKSGRNAAHVDRFLGTISFPFNVKSPSLDTKRTLGGSESRY